MSSSLAVPVVYAVIGDKERSDKAVFAEHKELARFGVEEKIVAVLLTLGKNIVGGIVYQSICLVKILLLGNVPELSAVLQEMGLIKLLSPESVVGRLGDSHLYSALVRLIVLIIKGYGTAALFNACYRKGELALFGLSRLSGNGFGASPVLYAFAARIDSYLYGLPLFKGDAFVRYPDVLCAVRNAYGSFIGSLCSRFGSESA